MNLKDFHKADIEGKAVFLRMDYNVPIIDNEIQDDYKITSSFSTIVDVYKMNPKNIIIGTHLGRPKGVYDNKYSIYPVFYDLKKMIFDHFEKNIIFCGYDGYREYKFVIIENLRFYPEEENRQDQSCSNIENKRLLSNFFEDNVDLVIVDAFGCLHRDAYSITKTNKPTYAGNLVMKEVKVGTEIMRESIDLIILGGCKVTDKIGLVKSLISKCKSIFIVGGLAYTFLKFRHGKEVGKSVVSEDSKDIVDLIYSLAQKDNVEIYLPDDFVIEVDGRVICDEEIPKEGSGYDIGPKTIERLREEISNHEKIFWNGTPGVFEKEKYSHGTEALVNILAEHGQVVVGGGETSACVRKFSSTDKFYHVSTGGGAFLKLLSGEELPGLNVLKE